MLLIGSHVSFKSSDQMLGSVKEALSYGANTFMFYTGAPQNTNRCSINDDLTKEAIKLMNDNNIDIKNIVVHAPYIINLANNQKEESYLFAINFLKQEIKRVEQLGVEKLVLHPGSSVGLSLEEGINNIVNALNEVLDKDTRVKICLETMAGKGTETCYDINQIKQIIDRVKYNDKLMVCLDTCHLNDAGYDMTDFNKFLDYFDKVIGIHRIGVVHVNDSKNSISSHKDRHENIGYGFIGFKPLLDIVYNPLLENVPKILETPYISLNGGKDRTYAPYKFEIDMFKNKEFNENLYEDIRNYYEK